MYPDIPLPGYITVYEITSNKQKNIFYITFKWWIEEAIMHFSFKYVQHIWQMLIPTLCTPVNPSNYENKICATLYM